MMTKLDRAMMRIAAVRRLRAELMLELAKAKDRPDGLREARVAVTRPFAEVLYTFICQTLTDLADYTVCQPAVWSDPADPRKCWVSITIVKRPKPNEAEARAVGSAPAIGDG